MLRKKKSLTSKNLKRFWLREIFKKNNERTLQQFSTWNANRG